MEYRFDEMLEDCKKMGTKIPASDYLSEGLYPIVDQGQKEIAGYRNSPAFCQSLSQLETLRRSLMQRYFFQMTNKKQTLP